MYWKIREGDSRLVNRVFIALLVIIAALSIVLLSASLGRGASSVMGTQLRELQVFVHTETEAVFHRGGSGNGDGDDASSSATTTIYRDDTDMADEGILPPCQEGGVALYTSSGSDAHSRSRKCSLGVKYGGEAVVEASELVTASMVNLSRRRMLSDWVFAAEILNAFRVEKGQKEVSLELLDKSEYRTDHPLATCALLHVYYVCRACEQICSIETEFLPLFGRVFCMLYGVRACVVCVVDCDHV